MNYPKMEPHKHRRIGSSITSHYKRPDLSVLSQSRPLHGLLQVEQEG
jgi:hypothetical protein